jgi:hypothetical protein
MTFEQFQAALAKLLSIPEGEKVRALAVAPRLSDGDRLEFHRYLQGFETTLAHIAKDEERMIADAETAVLTAEHRVARFERGDQEQAEHAGEMSTVENQFPSSSDAI